MTRSRTWSIPIKDDGTIDLDDASLVSDTADGPPIDGDGVARDARSVSSPEAAGRATPGGFQERVAPWMLACFGPEISRDRIERNHRFLEEALELVQACGCTQSEAHQLVDYVFGRPVGEPFQEVGGVMVTLAALCLANDLDMHQNGETELARIWTKVEQIRAKQAAKPDHSPLPGPSADRSASEDRSESDSGASTITALREALRDLFKASAETVVAVGNFTEANLPHLKAMPAPDTFEAVGTAVDACVAPLRKARELLK